MRVGVVGINFRTSALPLREMVARASHRSFLGEEGVACALHCVCLSTCNRMEIYFSAEDLAFAHSEILAALRTHVKPPEPFEAHMYSYFGADCFRHLATVTAGFDSVILAETEIQRQVKCAYERALLEYPLPSGMHFMFQKALKIGKQLRSTFPHLLQKRSLEQLVYFLGNSLLGDLTKSSMLFIGNSEINRKMIAFFKSQGVLAMTLCTRAPHSAREFLVTKDLPLLEWKKLEEWTRYPFVICASNHASYLLTDAHKGGETRLIVDLSVPRIVDPQLGKHPQMSLFNIEELGRLIRTRQQDREDVQRGKECIHSSVERQMQIFSLKTQKASERLLCPC